MRWPLALVFALAIVVTTGLTSNTGESSELDREAFNEIAVQMAARIYNGSATAREIAQDCAFRRHGRQSSIDRCAQDEEAIYRQMRQIFIDEPHELSQAAVVLCMDRYPSMNGFDWSRVRWCYEQLMIAQRRR